VCRADEDGGLPVAQLASKIGVSRRTVNQLVSERRAVSPGMALRLAHFFSTSPQHWLNMQRNVDIWDSFDEDGPSIESIEPLSAAVL
jgi:addiction module HigA family antidote